MTTQPKRLTAEAEAMEIAIKFAKFPMGKPVYGPVWCEALSDAIAAALRQRDELYAKAWEECKEHRDPGSAGRDAGAKHDAARKAAGLEDA